MIIYNVEEFILDNIVNPYMPEWIYYPLHTNEGRKERALLLREIRNHPRRVIGLCSKHPEGAKKAFRRIAEIGHSKVLQWYWAIDTNDDLIKWIAKETMNEGYEIRQQPSP